MNREGRDSDFSRRVTRALVLGPWGVALAAAVATVVLRALVWGSS